MNLRSSIQIGGIIRNAVFFEMKNWLGEPMNSDSLIQAVQDSFPLLEQRRVAEKTGFRFEERFETFIEAIGDTAIDVLYTRSRKV
jgi:hypothetical protein